MKKIIIVILIVLIVIFTSAFTVEKHEVAIVTGASAQVPVLYQSGLHYTWPVVNRVSYISLKPQYFPLTVAISTTKEQPSYQALTLVTWRVTDPLIFYRAVNMGDASTNTTNIINKELELNAFNLVNLAWQQQKNIITFNQKPDLLLNPIQVEKYGIAIEQIEVSGMNILPPLYTEKVDDAGQMQTLSDKVITNAYLHAKQIEAETSIQQKNIYQTITKKDAKFYNYFWRLQQYRQTAKSESEVPAFNKLYY